MSVNAVDPDFGAPPLNTLSFVGRKVQAKKVMNSQFPQLIGIESAVKLLRFSDFMGQ